MNISPEDTAVEFVQTRICKAIFNNEIPDPRDITIICLINTCDVFRFIFQLEDADEERIQLICKMDLIDRYKPPRNEHRSPGYAPYGLGPHTCLGSRWMELQLAVNVLMIVHYFNLEISPANFKLRFSPLPSMKPSKKLKFIIAEQRREVSV